MRVSSFPIHLNMLVIQSFSLSDTSSLSLSLSFFLTLLYVIHIQWRTSCCVDCKIRSLACMNYLYTRFYFFFFVSAGNATPKDISELFS